MQEIIDQITRDLVERINFVSQRARTELDEEGRRKYVTVLVELRSELRAYAMETYPTTPQPNMTLPDLNNTLK